jgi:hypothetical protein
MISGIPPLLEGGGKVRGIHNGNQQSACHCGSARLNGKR